MSKLTTSHVYSNIIITSVYITYLLV
jgi:hypothetical protein